MKKCPIAGNLTMKAVDTTKWLIINTQSAAICTVRFVSLAGEPKAFCYNPWFIADFQ